MANCPTDEELVRLKDLDLPAARNAQVRDHVGHCEACKRRAKALDVSWIALGMLPDVEPRPEFNAAVKNRLRAAPIAGRFSPWFIVAAAAVLLFCAVVVIYMRNSASFLNEVNLPPPDQHDPVATPNPDVTPTPVTNVKPAEHADQTTPVEPISVAPAPDAGSLDEIFTELELVDSMELANDISVLDSVTSSRQLREAELDLELLELME